MLIFILILLLKILAFKSSIKKFKGFKKGRNMLEYLFLITTVTNLLHLIYILCKITGIEDNKFGSSVFSILVPNIITMSLYYWIILSPHIKLSDNINYSCLYLHLFSALFVISDYINNPRELSYTPNIYWFIFLYSIVILNKIIVGNWSYKNLTNIYKTHSHMLFNIYAAVVLFLVRILNNTYV